MTVPIEDDDLEAALDMVCVGAKDFLMEVRNALVRHQFDARDTADEEGCGDCDSRNGVHAAGCCYIALIQRVERLIERSELH